MKKNTQMELTLNHQVNKPAGLIFNYLTDMKSFVAVHPVINSMKYLGENTYRVSETLPWGLIPCSISYRATVEIYYESKKIVMTAVGMKFVSIEIVFIITESNGYSLIEEKVSFKTSLPILQILKKTFTKQHARLFKNIEKLA